MREIHTARPFHDANFLAGRRTISARTFTDIPADPYAVEIEAVDSLLPGEWP